MSQSKASLDHELCVSGSGKCADGCREKFVDTREFASALFPDLSLTLIERKWVRKMCIVQYGMYSTVCRSMYILYIDMYVGVGQFRKDSIMSYSYNVHTYVVIM